MPIYYFYDRGVAREILLGGANVKFLLLGLYFVSCRKNSLCFDNYWGGGGGGASASAPDHILKKYAKLFCTIIYNHERNIIKLSFIVLEL